MNQKFYKTLLMLSILGMVISCGQSGKSGAKLEISRGFLASNTGFDGGLIVVGRHNISGESFSLDLTSGTDGKFELTKGPWSFRAVGWDGGNLSNKIFGGKTYCGKMDASLTQNAQTVSISVSELNCDDVAFASPQYRQGANPHLFKQVGLVLTCNSFFDHNLGPISDTTSVSSKTYQSTTSSSFCTSANKMPNDYLSKIKSIKISAVKKYPGQPFTHGFSTACLSATTGNMSPTSNGYTTFKELFLPTMIPLIIDTFEDVSCTESVASIPFIKGLENTHADFDHVLVDIAGPEELRLLLPANKIKRGFSPFIHLAPFFACTGGSPVICPVLPSSSLGASFHGYDSTPSYTNSFIDEEASACAAPTAVPGTLTATCNLVDGKAQISWTSSATGSGTISMVVGGTTKTYPVFIVPNSTFERDKHLIQSKIIDLVGKPDSNFPRTFFRDNKSNSDNELYGVLAEVRDMFSADGPGGLLGLGSLAVAADFGMACGGISGSKEITVYERDEMKMKTYKASVTSPTSSTNKYVCDALNPAATTCPDLYQKKLEIYDYSVSTLVPVVNLEFHCRENFGKYVKSETHSKDGKSRQEKQVVNWNTDLSNLSNQRFENLIISRQFDTSGFLENENRSLTRVQKTAASDYEIWDYEFGTQKSASVWNQHMTRFQGRVIPGTQLCYNIYNTPGISLPLFNSLLVDTSGAMVTERTTSPSTSITSNGFVLTNAINAQSVSNAGCSINPFTSLPTPNNKFNETLNFELESLKTMEAQLN